MRISVAFSKLQIIDKFAKKTRMIIIAGAEHPRSKKYISLKAKHCYHCNNVTFWVFEETKYFISLFFIPVAPYRKSYQTYCSICGQSEKLEKEVFKSLIRSEAREYK